MTVTGDLQDLDLLTLLQMTCEEGGTAQIQLARGPHQAVLYVAEGQIAHAELDELIGEEAVYQLLAWRRGRFDLTRHASAPTISIQQDWNSLLLEGLRRLDERGHAPDDDDDDPPHDYSPQEEPTMATATVTKRSEALSETLEQILSNSSDIQGAMVVSTDGLVMASRLPSGQEDNRVGAVSAGVLSLGVRSVTQLGRGDFQQILAQGSKGNVVVTSAGDKAAFVALTTQNVNLGMVFLEAREGAERIAAILG